MTARNPHAIDPFLAAMTEIDVTARVVECQRHIKEVDGVAGEKFRDESGRYWRWQFNEAQTELYNRQRRRAK